MMSAFGDKAENNMLVPSFSGFDPERAWLLAQSAWQPL
jgi:hypothetical protein